MRLFLKFGGNGQGWRKDLENGDVAIVLHNRDNSTEALGFDFKDAGFAPDTHVHLRDMLKQVQFPSPFSRPTYLIDTPTKVSLNRLELTGIYAMFWNESIVPEK